MGYPREISLLAEVPVRGSHRPVSPCNAPCSLPERDYLEVGFIEGCSLSSGVGFYGATGVIETWFLYFSMPLRSANRNSLNRYLVLSKNFTGKLS